MAPGCAKPRVRESDFNWKATTNIRGICCARRLPPNFDGGRAPLWTSRYFISCGRPFRWNEHREREKEGEGGWARGDRRKLEWFSNRFPFRVRANTRRQGLSNSQPPGLPFRKLSFKCLRTGYELAQHVYPFHCALVSKSTNRDRRLYSIGSSYLTDQSFFLFQKEFYFFYTSSYSEIIRENFWSSWQEDQYLPRKRWIEIRFPRGVVQKRHRCHRYLLSILSFLNPPLLLSLSSISFIESILLQKSLRIRSRWLGQHPSRASDPSSREIR